MISYRVDAKHGKGWKGMYFSLLQIPVGGPPGSVVAAAMGSPMVLCARLCCKRPKRIIERRNMFRV